MGALDHWHPVALSRELNGRPRAVEVHGRALAVFRGAWVRVGAVDDVCPHRGMSLSRGRIEQDRIVCPYHGWAFGADGRGIWPVSPGRREATESFEVQERYGLVWVKPRGAEGDIPGLQRPGAVLLHTMHVPVSAPLELALDNFCEVEHTASVHAFLGYDAKDLERVVTRVETGPDEVRVDNRGPQKRLPPMLHRVFGSRPGDLFVDAWITRFSPVHCLYRHFWVDPDTGQERPDQLNIAVVFTPTSRQTTDLFVLAYGVGPRVQNRWWRRLVAPLARNLVALEVHRDRRLLEQMAERAPTDLGGRLTRFDKALAENRRRLASVYRATV